MDEDLIEQAYTESYMRSQSGSGEEIGGVLTWLRWSDHPVRKLYRNMAIEVAVLSSRAPAVAAAIHSSLPIFLGTGVAT